MLINEQTVILQYLRRHPLARVTDLLQCLPGASLSLGERILSELEWLGYVAFFPAESGESAMVQITPRGVQAIQGYQPWASATR